MLLLALLAMGATHRMRANQLRAELDQVRQEIAAGRLGVARRSLVHLAGRWPRNGEVLFLLGQCDESLGQAERALAAWAQIPASDPNFARAAESQGHVLINQGRYAAAEALLLKALGEATQSEQYRILRTIARLYRLEGRFDAVSEALTAAWGSVPDPSGSLQDLWQNDTEPVRVDLWKLFLDAADNGDDRVWLGRARYALMTGRFDDARMWLARCVDSRPNDPAVWQGFLDLAVAKSDVAGFWEAAGRLPSAAVRDSEIPRLRCWFASKSGDRGAERREWARMVELQPSDSGALERLAELSLEEGDAKEAERLRRRKAEVDRAKDRIDKLVKRGLDFRPHASELAELSAILGRHFDAHAWALIAATAPAQPASSRTDAAEPPRVDSRLDRARTYCRAAADRARLRLLAQSGEPRARGLGIIAERLADMRGAVKWGNGASPARQGPAEARASAYRFVDDADPAGLRFMFDNGHSARWLLPETLSGGVGLLDFDGDGWLDVYCVQGGPVAAPSLETPSTANAEPQPGDRLFRNQRDGTFRDMTRETGLARLAWGRGYGQGVAVGDYDNDGHPDLFVTRLNHYALYRNRGDGTFEDSTQRAGLSGERQNPTSAAFADLDGDGDLDLYVCHYARWDPDHPPLCKNERGNYYCDPAVYEPAGDHVFRNDGGNFVDASQEGGFTDPDGRGLGVVAADFDDDNRVDLYVANDGTANFLFGNRGGFRFEEEAMTAGVAAGAEGGYRAGMGVAAADLDADGRLDLLVTNLYGEGATFYQNLGNGMFADRSVGSGLFGATRFLTGFGIAVFDAANGARPVVAIANGHVNDFRPTLPFAMPSLLLERRADGRLVEVSDRSGPPWSVPRLGRGMAAGDLDNDGRVDLLIVSQDQPLAYFHNQTERPGHFITLRLEGTKSNRDGVGARVVVATAQGRQVSQRVGGGSYLSASDGRLHFGLGTSTTVNSLEVRWPSGRLDCWKEIPADTGYLLREGDPAPRPLAGFADRPTRSDRGPRF
jgi:tetratricopeptide (TPR) repeat protein